MPPFDTNGIKNGKSFNNAQMLEQGEHMRSAKTVNEQEVALKTSGGSVMVGGANVVKADIHATNGVIHVIDSVILPK